MAPSLRGLRRGAARARGRHAAGQRRHGGRCPRLDLLAQPSLLRGAPGRPCVDLSFGRQHIFLVRRLPHACAAAAAG
eukprot:15335317-Alexandrium_andersonii.AAC.1